MGLRKPRLANSIFMNPESNISKLADRAAVLQKLTNQVELISPSFKLSRINVASIYITPKPITLAAHINSFTQQKPLH